MHHVRYFFTFFLALSSNVANAQSQEENKQQWTAEEFWKNATSKGICVEKGAIVLENQQLVEDDSPGFGFDSDPASNEVLKQGVLLRKTLIVERVPVKGAYAVALLYPENPSMPNNGRHVVFNVNGYETTYEVNHFWTKASIPGSVIKKGENIITVRTLEPDTRFRTWFALDENYAMGSSTRIHAPGRSARSTDGGKTWDTKHIGENGTATGEYAIRLKMKAYRNEGWIESPVVDLAENAKGGILQREAIIHRLKIKTEIIHPAGTASELYVRSGSTLMPGDSNWSQWSTTSGLLEEQMLKGRFLQIRIALKSTDPLKTPTLKSVQCASTVEYHGNDPRAEFRVLSAKHFPLQSSSFSFEYENPNDERVRNLRKKFKFDEIVQETATEFEKMLQLKSWVAQQWKWHLLKPGDDIFEWDAEKILTPDTNGNIYGGFCLHYAIVMMQALQSFGFEARLVSADYAVWGGHEICEVWSNDFGKWIMLDANFDTYFVDSTTGVPLNVLELHKAFVQEFYPNSTIDRDNWSRKKLAQLASTRARNIPVVCMVGGGANNKTLKQYEWWNPPVDLSEYCGGYGPLTMGYIRYMPRANYLSKPGPIPINHGRIHWGWTGYYCWVDPHTPQSQELEIFSNRENDFYWNINQVGMHVTAANDGILRVFIASNTPDFAYYEVTLNGLVTKHKENSLRVKCVRGINRLEIRSIDAMGNKGTPSHLELIYLPIHEQNSPL